MQQSALSPSVLPRQKFGQSSASTGRVVKSSDVAHLRVAILAYAFLWVFEGALRKWFFTSLANPLLLVRDPLVLYIYYRAFRMGVFPRNVWIISLFILTTYSAIISLGTLGNIPTVIYGWRTTFFHFPLIWIISVILGEREIRLVERWVLMLTPALAALMAMQFLAPSSSWLNAGASEGSAQLGGAMGHVRPAATFSYISGPVYFYALASAFLTYSQLTSKSYSVPLTVTALFSCLGAAAVSTSRLLLSYIGIVFLTALISGLVLAPKLILKKPQLIFRWFGALVFLYITGVLLLNVPVFQVGLEVFETRITGASANEGGAQGFVDRYFSNMTAAIPAFFEAPPLGHGLGLGTQVGAVLTTGDANSFTLGEDEWPRQILESGPILGSLLIVWRIGLTLWLLKKSVSCALWGDPLPLLIFASVGLTLLGGGIGQTTTLGFVVFTAGLALAAVRVKEADRQRNRTTSMQKRGAH